MDKGKTSDLGLTKDIYQGQSLVILCNRIPLRWKRLRPAHFYSGLIFLAVVYHIWSVLFARRYIYASPTPHCKCGV